MDVNGWLQAALILATLLPFLYTLHVQNRSRSNENARKLDVLTDLTAKHDKRTRKLRKQLQEHIKLYHLRNGRKDHEPGSA